MDKDKAFVLPTLVPRTPSRLPLAPKKPVATQLSFVLAVQLIVAGDVSVSVMPGGINYMNKS